jgi:hypothetical protein
MDYRYVPHLLSFTVHKLSDGNYEQSFASYKFWFDIGLEYSELPPDKIFHDIRNQCIRSAARALDRDGLLHPTAHLIIRFASDAESDSTLAPHAAGLQRRLCKWTLADFFEKSCRCFLCPLKGMIDTTLAVDANLIAAWANLGCVEETDIRDRILQSLTAFPSLDGAQADAIIVLFRTAGATFEAHTDPLVVDRCFELLKSHYDSNPKKRKLVQARMPPR